MPLLVKSMSPERAYITVCFVIALAVNAFEAM